VKLVSPLTPKNVKEQICGVLSHQVCGDYDSSHGKPFHKFSHRTG
jgi:hypothetical protein